MHLLRFIFSENLKFLHLILFRVFYRKHYPSLINIYSLLFPADFIPMSWSHYLQNGMSCLYSPFSPHSVYIPVDESDSDTILFTILTGIRQMARKWKIKITQLPLFSVSPPVRSVLGVVSIRTKLFSPK